MRTFRNMITAGVSAAVLAGSSLLALPGAAVAAPQEGIGHETTPGQPYGGVQRTRDWLGSYLVGGQQVWCVQFALKAPDSGQEYQPGDELRTKWGTALPADTAANISYLLLRYGSTKAPDQAAALAHLLHSWTAAPRNAADLDPAKNFKDIAYDVDFQYGKLSPAVRDQVERMRSEAAANRGPWHAELIAPEGAQTIGRTAQWKLPVRRGDGQDVPGVPVQLHVTDAKVEGAGPDGIVTTPESGEQLSLRVTPTGPHPKITGELAEPAEHPYVKQAVHQPGSVQRVVSTGGEKKLPLAAETTAVTAPGGVRIGKIDEQSKAGIDGVALRLTGPDGTTPAVRQDGGPLTGPDGKPIVITTGPDGTAAVPDLRTPQEIRITEVAPARGYEDAFDEQAPPSVSGTVTPGDTLALNLANKANTPTVPITIPAGDPTGGAAVHDASLQPSGGLIGLAGLALAGLALGTGAALRRRTHPAGQR